MGDKKAKKDKSDKKEKKAKKDKKRPRDDAAAAAESEAKRAKQGSEWTEAGLGGKRQEKFEKLMGAHKDHDEDAEQCAKDSINYFHGKSVEADTNGDLLIRKGQYQIYLPATLQKQKHHFKSAINKDTAKEIEENLIKQDEAARKGRKAKGLGIGFGSAKPEGMEISNPDWKPVEHATFSSDDEGDAAAAKKEKKSKKNKKDKKDKKDKKQ